MKTIILLMLATIVNITAQVTSIPVLELKIENEFLLELNKYRRENKLDTLKEDCFMKEVSRLNTERIVNNDSLCFSQGKWNSVQEMRDAFHYNHLSRARILFFDSINNPDFKNYDSYQEITCSSHMFSHNDLIELYVYFLNAFKNSIDHNVVMLYNKHRLVGVKCNLKWNSIKKAYAVSINVCFSRIRTSEELTKK